MEEKKSQQKNRVVYYNKSSKDIGTLLWLCSLGEHQMQKQSLMGFLVGVHVCRVYLFVIFKVPMSMMRIWKLSVCVCFVYIQNMKSKVIWSGNCWNICCDKCIAYILGFFAHLFGVHINSRPKTTTTKNKRTSWVNIGVNILVSMFVHAVSRSMQSLSILHSLFFCFHWFSWATAFHKPACKWVDVVCLACTKFEFVCISLEVISFCLSV